VFGAAYGASAYLINVSPLAAAATNPHFDR
jgi:hypothetical protein